uniref:Uncharacterized protein n=1 Tax=Anguilla anguilla TaxID=7936 RepID=A0A0E9S5J7_ANGAN
MFVIFSKAESFLKSSCIVAEMYHCLPTLQLSISFFSLFLEIRNTTARFN